MTLADALRIIEHSGFARLDLPLVVGGKEVTSLAVLTTSVAGTGAPAVEIDFNHTSGEG